MFSSGFTNGRSPGRVSLGVVRPPPVLRFGGATASESRCSSFDIRVYVDIDVEIAGAVNMLFESGIDDPYLGWWAGDDRGNAYFGNIGSWSAGGGHAAGEVQFWPPLDPRAVRLDLMPTGSTTGSRCSAPPPSGPPPSRSS